MSSSDSEETIDDDFAIDVLQVLPKLGTFFS